MEFPCDVVFFASKEWSSHRQRPHWVAAELARRGAHVLFVENLGTRLPHLSEWHRVAAKLRRWAWASAPRQSHEVAPRIAVDAPLVPPLQHWPGVRRLSGALLARRIRRRLPPRPKGRVLVVWTYLPMPIIRDVAPLLDADLLVYDWADDASAHMVGASPAQRQRVAAWEETMLTAADLVFVASAELLRRTAARPNAVALPHGAPRAREAPRRSDDDGSDRQPTVGFVGSITEFTDLELVAELARARPQWSFVMVGPARVPLYELRAMPNVIIAGEQDYDEVHRFLASFDAAIVPYRLTPAIEVSSPLKVHEYLAHGLPVVSVDIPEVRALTPRVEVAAGTDAFLAALDRAVIKGKGPADPSGTTWEERVDEMIAHVDRALASRSEPPTAATG
jgi:glycosyltransferase involved in cell wall biosynthesis